MFDLLISPGVESGEEECNRERSAVFLPASFAEEVALSAFLIVGTGRSCPRTGNALSSSRANGAVCSFFTITASSLDFVLRCLERFCCGCCFVCTGSSAAGLLSRVDECGRGASVLEVVFDFDGVGDLDVFFASVVRSRDEAECGEMDFGRGADTTLFHEGVGLEERHRRGYTSTKSENLRGVSGCGWFLGRFMAHG